MLEEYCRIQRQIEALYAIQNEQWTENANKMTQYKKELNAQHMAMRERLAVHESDMQTLRNDIIRQLNETRAALREVTKSKE
jgi:hypothetical protein